MKTLLGLAAALVLNAWPVLAQPLANDLSTLLLLRFDSTTTGVGSETPTVATSIGYAAGMRGSAVQLGPTSALTYSSTGNIVAREGTVEFWIRPNWNGTESNGRILFALGTDLQIYKDGAGNLGMLMRNFDNESFHVVSVRSWASGGWHHVAATWSIPGSMHIYLDGTERVANPADYRDSIASLPASICIGHMNGGYQADAAYDELRISSSQRGADEIASDFLAGITITAMNFKLPTLRIWPTWRWPNNRLFAATNIGTMEIPGSGVTWTHVNSSATILDTGNGTVQGIAPGVDTIVATLGSASARQVLTVMTPARAPEFEDLDTAFAYPPENAVYKIPVVIVRYLPSVDGVNLDVGAVPDFYWFNPKTLSTVRNELDVFDRRSKFMLEEGSRFRAYGSQTVRPAIGYRVIGRITYYEPAPPGLLRAYAINGAPVYNLDYAGMMDRIGGRRLVDTLGVREFWVWQAGANPNWPSYDSTVNLPEYFREVDESNMSSPITGDISNSTRRNDDMPVYNHSYVVYGQNLRRSYNEVVHNHGHQYEAMLGYAAVQQDGNGDFFWRKFVGFDANGRATQARCGATHYPPNTSADYDWSNTTVVLSDIMDWKPIGIGTQSPVNVYTWANTPYAWPMGAPSFGLGETHWYIYWMQSYPGYNNVIPNGTDSVSNWWEQVADWDLANSMSLRLHDNRPNGPGLNLPSDGTAGLDTALTISWDAVPRAFRYWVQVSADSLFTLPLVDDSLSTATTRSVSALSSSSRYFWRIRARGNAGWSRWSQARTFSTRSCVQPVVTENPVSSPLLCPGASYTFRAAAAGTPVPTIQWQRSTDAGVTYSNIAGATADSLVLTGVQTTSSGTQFRASFTNACAVVYGAPATLLVGDTVDPIIAVTLSPTSIWPATNQLETVDVSVTTSDNCGSPTWQLVSVTGDDGAGAGDIDATTGTAPSSFRVRASRSGSGSGRTYTATFRATDGIGNTGTAVATVLVPHDQGNHKPTATRGSSPFTDIVAPNPTSGSTSIGFHLGEAEHVVISVHDANGSEIARLLDAEMRSGDHATVWTGVDSYGHKVPSGTYYYTIQCGAESASGRIVIVR